ncbi:Leucine-responsive regulatory protein [archaeon HR01]|nr:Leucine-responsive regulatory protein [archaeon HR01]
MKAVVDEVDRAIIKILMRDGRRSFTDIGKELRLSEGAVRRRVKNLVDKGVIKSFTIDVERGYMVKAFTFVSVNPSTPTPQVAEALRKVYGVEDIYEITGQYDVVALLAVSDMVELNKGIEEIRHIPGVRDTNTSIILRHLKPSKTPTL